MWDDEICIDNAKTIKINHKTFIASYNKILLNNKSHEHIMRIVGCSSDILNAMIKKQGFDLAIYFKVLLLADILTECDSIQT